MAHRTPHSHIRKQDRGVCLSSAKVEWLWSAKNRDEFHGPDSCGGFQSVLMMQPLILNRQHLERVLALSWITTTSTDLTERWPSRRPPARPVVRAGNGVGRGSYPASRSSWWCCSRVRLGCLNGFSHPTRTAHRVVTKPGETTNYTRRRHFHRPARTTSPAR
jgi:hypothetical protein